MKSVVHKVYKEDFNANMFNSKMIIISSPSALSHSVSSKEPVDGSNITVNLMVM